MMGMAACLFVLLPGTAQADYRLCNQTSYVLKAAIGYGEGDEIAELAKKIEETKAEANAMADYIKGQ